MTTRRPLIISSLICFLALFANQSPSQISFRFYAVYALLADNSVAQSGQGIYHSAMSADGKVVAFVTNGGGKASRIYVCGPDGSNLKYYEPEAQAKNLNGLTINEDGSRIFALDPYVPAIYKIQSGVVNKINLAVQNGPASVGYDIKTIASGEYAYFIAAGDLWRVRQDGTGLAMVINDTQVPFNGGVGHTIYEFAISADGGTILFRFWGYWLDGVERGLSELFIYRSGTPTRITTDGQGKLRLAISQDGSKIAFEKVDEWYSADSSGGNVKDLGPGDRYSNQAPAMTYDGSKLFVHDFGGRMIQTDGSGQLDLMGGFPLYHSTYTDESISKDGTHVLFQSDQTNNWGIFYGHLNDQQALASAPQINSITFEPYAMVRNNTSAKVIMRAALSSPNGLSDLKTVGIYALLSGMAEGNSSKLPVRFPFQPLDDGKYPDTTASDGVYASEGLPSTLINQYNEMTVRIGVKNASKTFVYADVVLPIVNSLSAITLTSPNGGENWKTGTKYNIAWTYSGLTGDVTIDLYKGNSKYSTIGTAAASAGTFAWAIPSNLAPGNDYKVKIFQGSVEDYSNAAFAVSMGTQNRRYELIGTWSAYGVYYLNSDTEVWTRWSGPASIICGGDVDGDGLDDLVGVWPSSGVWVRFTATGEWKLIEGSVPDWLAVGDVTGDGKADIVGLWGATVWGRDSATGAWYTISAGATMGVGGDLDGDGRVDVIGVWPSQGGVYVRYAATGKWEYLTSTPDWIAAGDMNGDGKDDLIGIWGGAVWARDSVTKSWTQLTAGASKVWARDFDGDGKADLVGIWPSGVWVKFSSDNSWKKLSSAADWLALGRFR